MRPILFSYLQTRAQGFNTLGQGVLTDAISCSVTEELNGAFELELVYPMTGIHAGKFHINQIILASTTPRDSSGWNTQPFRVYSVIPNADGTITLLARHLSYDLTGIPITTLFGSGGVGVTLSQLCTYMTTYAAFTNDFAYSTDYTGGQLFFTEDLMSIRALIGQAIETFGVDVEFDGWDVKFLQHRGANRGVRILYGNNMVSLSQEVSIDEQYSGVYAYYKNGSGDVTVQTRVDVPGNSKIKLLTVDLSDQFDDEPSVASLQAAASAYITANNIGHASSTLNFSFVQFRDMSDGTVKDDSVIRIGDDVLIKHRDILNKTVRINRIVYDVLADEITEVGVGPSDKNIQGTVATASEVSAQNANKMKMVEDIVGKYCLQYRQQLTSGSLNDVKRQGHYYVVSAYVNSVSDKPSDVTSAYNLIHLNSAGTRGMQVLYLNTGTPSGFWWRTCTSGGSWSSWKKITDDTPIDISSGFSVDSATGCTASIADAYYVHGMVTVRVNTTTNTSIAAGNAAGTYSVTLGCPTGFAPKMVVNSASYYSGRAVVAYMNTSGVINLFNCGSSAITSGHSVNLTFTYPCG